MTSISPVPTGRISDLLLQGRVTTQLQRNQADLLRLQDQISSGVRLSVPSDDVFAAQRAIQIQRLLEQKEQAKTNLATSQSYLAATETAIAGVSGLLSEIRAAALGVADSAHSDTERAAAAQQVQQAIATLTDAANQQFRGRNLFAGSGTTVRPFELAGDHVAYQGNEAQIHSYADVDLLF